MMYSSTYWDMYLGFFFLSFLMSQYMASAYYTHRYLIDYLLLIGVF